MSPPIRIANCSGFFGDRLSAAREMVEGGPIDVLTGDYLAELTMAILARQRMRDPDAGYARTFLEQMEHVLGPCLDRGIKIVANAGGLNPAGLGERVGTLAAELGLEPSVAVVEGDDLAERGEDLERTLVHALDGVTMETRGLQALTANAYLGGWGIAAALGRGADVVVTGRVSDAALVLGPAAHHHRWPRDGWNRLAGAVVAGHVVECGAQATGGNFSFFREIPGLEHPGFPIAEIYDDGSSVITKHPGTGGAVTIETITSQLLYEIGGPRYLNPDVTSRFDTIRLKREGTDRIRISDVRGEPPPATTKVAASAFAGYRNSVTFLLAGLDVAAKAELVEAALWDATGGRQQYASTETRLMRTDRSDPPSNEAAIAHLKVTVTDPDPERVGRAFSGAAVELALASYPGFTTFAPPGRERPLVVYWPSLVEQPVTRVTIAGETSLVEPPSAHGSPDEAGGDAAESVVAGHRHTAETIAVPIGRLVGARSGDKGGDANLGVFARNDAVHAWLEQFLTVDRLRDLLPEARDVDVDRFAFPNLRAVNFVLRGLLGEGVSTSTRWDPQAKSLAEYFRAKVVEVPKTLV